MVDFLSVDDVEQGDTLGTCTVCDDDDEEEGTLGSCIGEEGGGTLVDTLGSETGGFGEDESESGGKMSFLFKRIASLDSALYDGSPAYKEGQMVEGGFLRRVTRSVAVCFKKSISFT